MGLDHRIGFLKAGYDAGQFAFLGELQSGTDITLPRRHCVGFTPTRARRHAQAGSSFGT
jgi:hypothetical protein